MPTPPSDQRLRILFLAANPTDSARLRLDEESRAIGERLEMAKFRDRFELIKAFAVRPDDLTRLLLKHEPHIVHFSGHGDETSGRLILQNPDGKAVTVPVETLREIFRVLKGNIRCVVLNACYLEEQGRAIAEEIDCVVGMAAAIGDEQARRFAVEFYQGLAFGQTLQTAFDLGKIGSRLDSAAAASIPQLLMRPGVDPSMMLLLENKPAVAPATTAVSTSGEFDVFISHATGDDDTVTRIADRLAAAGIRTWVDHQRGITYGDNWDRAIHEAANACTYGLFILSPHSAKSEYCIAEWNRILALGKRLYIALIDPVPTADIPLRLGTIQYADLTKDFDGALTALIEAMTARRDLDPAAPTTEKALRLTGPFPRWQLDLPVLGRDEDLTAVRELLAAANHRAVVVLGLGGVGKTRLAAEIAATADPARFPDGVIWHEIADYTTLATLTGLIRDHFGLTEKVTDEQVWQTLDRQAALLVLDNAEACQDPASYAARLSRLDLNGGTRVLITSRAEWRDLRNQKRYDLRHPAPEAAQAIFEEMLKVEPPTFSPNGQMPALVKAARYHPRLMQYTVRWLNDFPPPQVLDTLTTLKGADAEEALDDLVLKTVAQARTKPGGEAAMAALRRLAVCRGGFSYAAAQALMGAAEVPTALKLLKQWGLVVVEGERYDIDPLVAAAVGEDGSVFSAHYDYYTALANQHNKKQDYLGLDPDSANLEIAFERALTRDPEAAYWRRMLAMRFC